MSGAWGWLLKTVSGFLEPPEREAVLGDLAESDETGRRALLEVLGLVGRRQAAAWNNWRPWLAVLGLILPLGLFLSIVFRGVVSMSSVYAWMYLDNWRMADLGNRGFRLLLAETLGTAAVNYLMMICWSWTCGFTLTSLSGRAQWVNRSLFCLVLFGELLVNTQYFGAGNDPVFSLAFYRLMLPLILRIGLLFLPAMWGMAMGLRSGRLRRKTAIRLGAAILALTALTIWTDGWWQPATLRQVGLLILALWPVGYIVAQSVRSGGGRRGDDNSRLLSF